MRGARRDHPARHHQPAEPAPSRSHSITSLDTSARSPFNPACSHFHPVISPFNPGIRHFHPVISRPDLAISHSKPARSRPNPDVSHSPPDCSPLHPKHRPPHPDEPAEAVIPAQAGTQRLRCPAPSRFPSRNQPPETQQAARRRPAVPTTNALDQAAATCAGLRGPRAQRSPISRRSSSSPCAGPESLIWP